MSMKPYRLQEHLNVDTLPDTGGDFVSLEAAKGFRTLRVGEVKDLKRLERCLRGVLSKCSLAVCVTPRIYNNFCS